METTEKARLALEAARLEVEKERLKLEHERAVNDAERPFREAVMRFAELSVRSLLILNGAAALALIAFFGNAVKSDGSTIAAVVAQMRWAVLSFGAGAFLSVLTSCLSYLAQLSFTELAELGWSRWWGQGFRLFAIASALISLGFFACGIITVSNLQ